MCTYVDHVTMVSLNRLHIKGRKIYYLEDVFRLAVSQRQVLMNVEQHNR